MSSKCKDPEINRLLAEHPDDEELHRWVEEHADELNKLPSGEPDSGWHDLDGQRTRVVRLGPWAESIPARPGVDDGPVQSDDDQLRWYVDRLLSPRERDVFWLYNAGWSQKEIAKSLNISRRAIKVTLERLRAKLRKVLQRLE